MHQPAIKTRRGSTLLVMTMIFSLSMVLSVILIKIVYNTYATDRLIFEREQAFWGAEAGLEKGKTEVVHNPGWYTDLPHSPGDDVNWLSTAALGQDEGWFKLVREKDMDRLYAVGRSGKATVTLKIDFALSPFKVLTWEAL